MGRGSSKVANNRGGGTDTSVAYTRNLNRTQAKDEIVSILADEYSRRNPSGNVNPVLMSKDGRYSVATNWDEADYAMNEHGWKYEPLSQSESLELGNKAREIARERRERINRGR